MIIIEKMPEFLCFQKNTYICNTKKTTKTHDYEKRR